MHTIYQSITRHKSQPSRHSPTKSNGSNSTTDHVPTLPPLYINPLLSIVTPMLGLRLATPPPHTHKQSAHTHARRDSKFSEKMASFSPSLQVILVSTGVVSMALLLKVSVPLVLDFSYSQAPLMWVSLSSWLKPPYLYLLINCIIITIAASTRFHHHAHQSNDHQEQQEQMPHPVGIISAEGLPRQLEFDYPPADEDVGAYKPAIEEKVGAFVDKSVAEEMEASGGSVDVEDFVISRSSWVPPKRTDSSEISPAILSPEKPLVSARFVHRKPLKASPEGGRALRVARSKREETLENTWKMITEGRPMPLTRHLKKLDTWENQGRQISVALDPSPAKKSETFKDRTNCQDQPQSPATASPVSGKLRKEPSLSQDELNRRVEAFIKKFNEEMRLQRQESLKKYKEMVGRGTY